MIPDSVPYGLPSDSLAQRIGLPVWQRRQWNSGHLRTPRRRPSTRRSVESAESADRIGNRVLIPDPVHTMPPDPGLSTTTTAQEPQNTNNRPHLINRQVAGSMDQLSNYTPISNPGHNHNTRRPATDNDDYPRTAKFWQSTSTADTRHRATNHSADQTHGPNRKSCADS